MALRESNIYHLAEQSSSLSLVSLFVPLAFGLYWKRATERGALLSIILGMGTWIIGEVWDYGIPSILPGLAASILGMIIGSLVWKDDSHARFLRWKAEG